MAGKLTTQEFIKRSKEQHGERFSYEKTVYTGVFDPVIVTCNIHGDLNTSANRHLKGYGCTECADQVNKDKNQRAKSVFKEKAQKILGDNFDLSEADYVKSTTKVKVICKIHGEFWTTPSNILQGQSCPDCRKGEASKKFSMGKETFEARGKELFGDRYDYSLVEYVNAHVKVKLTCKKCGETFLQKPMDHLNGNGCNSCGRVQQLVTKRENYEEMFLKQAPLIHKGKYRYNLVNYKTMRSTVEIICMTCKDTFKQSPVYHLRGSGCNKCTENGYRVNKAGSLYVLKSKSMTKIGITNGRVASRISKINRHSPEKFEEYKSWKFEDGKEPSDIETNVLKILRESYASPTEKFDGFTECFLNLDPEVVVNLIVSNLTE